MIRYYLTFYWRSLKNSKILSIINALALAIGLSGSLLLGLYVMNELNQDRFHSNINDIYLLTYKYKSDKEFRPFSPFNQNRKDFFDTIPEVENFTHTIQLDENTKLELGDRKIKVQGLAVTPDFYQIFDFSILRSDSVLMTSKQYIFLTQKLAKNLFTDSNPIGKVVTLYHNEITEFVVAGILENPPANSSLQFDLIANYEALDFWGRMANDYLLMHPGKKPEHINAILDPLATATHYKKRPIVTQFFPLADVYFNSEFSIFPHGSQIQVKALAIVAAILLFIVLFNYYNLSISQSLTRLRSIGIKRVMGLQNKGLFWQFQLESLVNFCIALLLIMVTLILLEPYVTGFTGNKINLSSDIQEYVFLIPALLVLFLLTGFFLYLYFRSGAPVSMLKKQYYDHRRTISVKNNLVLVQFIIATVVVIATIVISQQTRFMMNQDYGYQQENIVKIKFIGDIYKDQKEVQYNNLQYVLAEIKQNANIIAYDYGKFPTETTLFSWNLNPEELPEAEDVNFIGLGPHFSELFDLEIVQGKSFNQDITQRSKEAIINQAAAEYYKLENPVGRIIENSSWGEFTIVGVLEDYHYQHLSHSIKPLIITRMPHIERGIIVKIASGKLMATMAEMEKLFKKVNPKEAFTYEFFDDQVAATYQRDLFISHILKWSTLFIFILSAVGLFSLSIVYSLQKTKEIGIRKILGATTANLLVLLGSKMTQRVLMAFLIASPLAYFIMQQWLKTFAYRIQIEWWYFALSGLAIFLLALIVISYNSLKTAWANPVDSLRSE